jgi:hypothetical protein
MLSLKIENQGYVDIMPESILAFEEVAEGSLEDRPNTKCGIFFDIGEGITSVYVENSYDVIKSVVPRLNFELNIPGVNARRITIPRDGIIYRQAIVTPEGEEPGEAKTLIKFRLGTNVIPITVKETREEIDLK